MACRHKHGAHVEQFACWVCGQCYQKLEGRPVRYGMVFTDGDENGARQQIVWQAEIKKSEDGITLEDYLRTMAKRMVLKCRGSLNLADAFDLALSAMRGVEDEFGDPAYDWSHAGALEMADEEMQYWEQETAETNE